MTGPGVARVLMTTDSVGGVWTYACELARALEPRGVRVVLAALGGEVDSGKRRQATRVPGLELFEGDYDLEWMEDPWDDLERARDWLGSLAGTVQPDVVHLNGYCHADGGWDVPVVVVGHSCVLSWWAAVRGDEVPSRLDRYRAEVERGLGAADAVVAPTDAHLRAMERQYGPLGGRVIPNARRPEDYPPGRGRRFALVVGRLWDPAKNVRAVEAAAREGLPWPVYAAGARRRPGKAGGGAAGGDLAGGGEGGGDRADGGEDGGDLAGGADGPPRDEAASSTDPPGSPPDPPAGDEAAGFRPLGELAPDELAGWYAAASIFVLPARYEPFGLAPLEAALAGCPLVLGDIETLREVWGNAAVFVPPDEPAALRNALGRLMRDDGLRRELATRARRRALEFDPDTMAGRYLELYRETRAGRAA